MMSEMTESQATAQRLREIAERDMPARQVAACDLWEGAEVLVRAATGETRLVEDVRPARWNGGPRRTVITLSDGRSLTLADGYLVTVTS